MIDSDWECDFDGLIDRNLSPSFQCWEEVIRDPRWKLAGLFHVLSHSFSDNVRILNSCCLRETSRMVWQISLVQQKKKVEHKPLTELMI